MFIPLFTTGSVQSQVVVCDFYPYLPHYLERKYIYGSIYGHDPPKQSDP